MSEDLPKAERLGPQVSQDHTTAAHFVGFCHLVNSNSNIVLCFTVEQRSLTTVTVSTATLAVHARLPVAPHEPWGPVCLAC